MREIGLYYAWQCCVWTAPGSFAGWSEGNSDLSSLPATSFTMTDRSANTERIFESPVHSSLTLLMSRSKSEQRVLLSLTSSVKLVTGHLTR